MLYLGPTKVTSSRRIPKNAASTQRVVTKYKKETVLMRKRLGNRGSLRIVQDVDPDIGKLAAIEPAIKMI